MLRGIERAAALLPALLNLTLAGAIITLLLVNLTDSWLPWYFIRFLRCLYAAEGAEGAEGAAGSAGFCLFMLAAMFLYVLSLSACGLALAAALRVTFIKVWQLAGR